MTVDNEVDYLVSADVSGKGVSARRLRRVLVIRWLRSIRTILILAILVSVPIIVFLALSGAEPRGDDEAGGPAEVLVRTFSGSGSDSTGTFVVNSEWSLEWRLDGLATDSLEITVHSSEGRQVGTIRHSGLGSGERVFEEGGIFRLSIVSTGDWNLRVVAVVDV